MKSKSISLKFFRVPGSWEVVMIRNSVELKPGDWINGDYVSQLCNRDDWDVTIAEPDYFSVVGNLPLPIPLKGKEPPGEES